MRILKYAIFISICIPFTAFGQNTDACLEKAMTQSEMNRCEGVNFERADAELNRVYKLLQKVYKDNKYFLSKLKISQRTWVKLRNSDLEMSFPKQNKQTEYGSVYPMCYSSISTTLTLQRVEYLKKWLEGIEEGDVCSGSIKRPDEIHHAINKI
ncbi:lysozyme inhibitor LprI family protein [Thiomicrorhabdus sp.]|uniref:lysozyme inhibitor LprI family protein n=1 Tax=Thiomicrorhabdus sp. TaxID=2039724 RepID=UPI0029C764EE|nr:lysozyme inhibitor LprI family protein [Thiomicrorhabdus sp.]